MASLICRHGSVAVLGTDDSLVTFANERSGKERIFLKYMNECHVMVQVR